MLQETALMLNFVRYSHLLFKNVALHFLGWLSFKLRMPCFVSDLLTQFLGEISLLLEVVFNYHFLIMFLPSHIMFCQSTENRDNQKDNEGP